MNERVYNYCGLFQLMEVRDANRIKIFERRFSTSLPFLQPTLPHGG
jgi:hypothetical protein